MLRLTDEQVQKKQWALEVELAKARGNLQDAQEKVMRAQERLSFFNELTQRAEEEKPPPQPPAKKTIIELTMKKPTVADASEKLLKEQGPLTTTELYKLLGDRGMIADTTTRNSLHMTLTKYKRQEKRFDRNQDGQWILKDKQKDGPGLFEGDRL